MQTKTYQASATILMSLSGAATVNEVYEATQASQQRLSSYAEIAGSRAVAQRAIDKLHVPMTADQLVGMTKVTYTPESLVFRITVADSDPQRVAALAGAMADQFAALVPQVEPKVVASSEQPAPAPYAYAAVVERPTVPNDPVSPVPKRNLALGLVAGVLLAVALALIRDATDRTVRTRETLDRVSGLPMLAELPRYRTATNTADSRAQRSAAVFEEAVRGLRTRLLAPAGPEPRSVLMTGPVIDEGATTTALNLSLSFTEIGEKVVLVEGDPRRPVIAGLVGVQSDVGLADVLAESRALDDAVHATSHTDLWVLASSKATGPDWHFGTAVLARTVEKLCARFDRVVIDGPPALATADAGDAGRGGRGHGVGGACRQDHGRRGGGGGGDSARGGWQCRGHGADRRPRVAPREGGRPGVPGEGQRGCMTSAVGRRNVAAAAAAGAVFLLGCFTVGVFAVRTYPTALMLIGALACLVVYLTKPQRMVWIALFLAFASLPPGLRHRPTMLGRYRCTTTRPRSFWPSCS